MSRLVFLDLETTGLDPQAGAEMLELAVVVTDDAFNELDCFEVLIRPSDSAHWDTVPDVRGLHERSGLLALCRGYRGESLEQAETLLLRFLSCYTSYGPLHLAGNSVHFDRGFLRRYWPDIERLFHHRHLDVSSLRMLGERVTTAGPFPGEKPHRAMEDVRRSIAEMHHWREALRR